MCNKEELKVIEDSKIIIANVYDYIKKYCLQSRETSLALTKLEEAYLWLKHSIDKHGVQENSNERGV